MTYTIRYYVGDAKTAEDLVFNARDAIAKTDAHCTNDQRVAHIVAEHSTHGIYIARHTDKDRMAVDARVANLEDRGWTSVLGQAAQSTDWLFPLDRFTIGFLTAALWTSDPNPGSGEWCEHDDREIRNIAASSIQDAIGDCQDFQSANADDLELYEELRPIRPDADYTIRECAGHDFLLSRNGHGAGFFDRGNDPVFDRLQDAARVYGSWDLDEDISEDGKIYHHG